MQTHTGIRASSREKTCSPCGVYLLIYYLLPTFLNGIVLCFHVSAFLFFGGGAACMCVCGTKQQRQGAKKRKECEREACTVYK